MLTDAELLERLNTRMPLTSALLKRHLLAVDIAAGTVRMSFETKREFCNPMGNVQGGFVAVMLDECAGVAALVKSGMRQVVPTIELKVTYFAPARMGVVFAEGRCLRLGQRVAFMEADLLDAEGNLLARLSASGLPLPLPTDALLTEAT